VWIVPQSRKVLRESQNSSALFVSESRTVALLLLLIALLGVSESARRLVQLRLKRVGD
jgi:hypothetical protein